MHLPSITLADGGRIFYRDSGSGKPLILLHGWAASGAFFERQAALASPGLRLVVPDQRGHGASLQPARGPSDRPQPASPATPALSIALLAADLRQLVVHLGLDDFCLAGWSMGALVAFEYVRTYGTAGLDKLSVIDMTAKIVTDESWEHGLNGDYPAAVVERTAHSVRSNWDHFAQVSARRLFARNASPEPALLRQFTALMRANDPEALAELWIDMARQDYRAVLPLLGPNCQFIYGEESRLYRPQMSRHLAQLARSPHVTGLAACGHMLQWERPQAFARALLGFLAPWAAEKPM